MHAIVLWNNVLKEMLQKTRIQKMQSKSFS